uniref:ABC-type glutathione-S-conjugate transporter n=1 Tax=Trichobilharzia regenti TaxID=157069 RepID=A0AA85JD32_TRIRE|nr:unnamed protein product [Trichobilharzia regenti]
MSENILFWTSFCGNSSVYWTFWNESFTWKTNTPDFTTCFQLTVLRWVSVLYLGVLLPIYVIFLSRKPWKNSSGMISAYKIVQFSIIGILLMTLLETVIITSTVEYGPGPLSVRVLDSVCDLFIWSTVLILQRYEFKKGLFSSGVVLIFWLYELLRYLVAFRSAILFASTSGHDSMTPVIMNGLILFHVTIAFWANCFASECDDEGDNLTLPRYKSKTAPEERGNASQLQKFCPEENAPFLSRMTFFWFTGLILKGFRRTLLAEDLWKLSDSNKSEHVVDRTMRNWLSTIESISHRVNEQTKHEHISYLEQYESDAYLNNVMPDKVNRPSLAFVLLRTFWTDFAAGFLLKLFCDILTLSQPLIISLLIGFVEEGTMKTSGKANALPNSNSSGFYQWHGYFYTVLLLIAGLIRTIVFQQYFHFTYRTAMRIKTAVIGMVYRKSLKLSNFARQTSTTGEIVNLISVDAQKLEDTMVNIHMIWSSPFLILCSLILLWYQLQYAVLAGLLTAIVLIPLNVFVGVKVKKLNTEMMKIKDERIKLLNQTIVGIKLVKMYAWEPAFEKRITELRNTEVNAIRSVEFLNLVSYMSLTCAPLLISSATFVTYVLMSPENVLTAQKSFVCLALFNVLTFPLSTLAYILALTVQSKVSLSRIVNFLFNEELVEQTIEKHHENKLRLNHEPEEYCNNIGETSLLNTQYDIICTKATLGWDSQTILFRNLNFSIPRGKFYGVVGPVGGGKSSLLSAILNEMHRFAGSIKVNGTIAYVSQQSWCQNATIRDNILFNRTMDNEWYKEVVRKCCLLEDLRQLPNGDGTEIGERGLNLSGGQKQRISLARAVYQQCDIYLLDDPLSAVDVRVAERLFKDVIGPNGLLKNKTRVWVTHRLDNLSHADKILLICKQNQRIENNFRIIDEFQGESAQPVSQCENPENMNSKESICQESYILEEGTHEELLKLDKLYASYYRTHISNSNGAKQGNSRIELPTNNGDQCGINHNCTDDLYRSNDTLSTRCGIEDYTSIFKSVEEEKTETGSISFRVLRAYGNAYGHWKLSLTFGAFILLGIAAITNQTWLGYWSGKESTKQFNLTNGSHTLLYYISIYSILAFLQVLFTGVQNILLNFGSASVSSITHSHLLRCILRAPSEFFDTTPSGRILNRFSKDIDIIDSQLPYNMRVALVTLSHVLVCFTLICIALPWFLIALVPIIGCLFILQRFYMATSRQLKRLESVRRSPVLSYFQETLSGISVIRAFKRENEFLNTCNELVDENLKAWYPIIVSYRWLGVNIELLGHFITLIACIIILLTVETVGPGFAGLALVYSLSVSNFLTFVIRSSSELENSTISIERVKEYSMIPSEGEWHLDEYNQQLEQWPKVGSIEFNNYSMGYRRELELVLKFVNVKINGGERVGIVGRTGAGKSSIISALFRLVEPNTGQIFIDCVNINLIGLHDLRQKLTVIPQDPFIFCGTLRYNLDPLCVKTDGELWNALEKAHLKEYVMAQSEQLDFMCSENGENLSVGQRQLVCLARALLRNSKILILDEATASVDMKTDNLIQETIRTQFTDCTVLTVSHRLGTIINSDKIITIANGQIVDYDTPENLLDNTNSILHKMAKDVGLI